MYTSTHHYRTPSQHSTRRPRFSRFPANLASDIARHTHSFLVGVAATAVLFWAWNLLIPAALVNAYAGWMGTLAIALGGAAWIQMWSIRSTLALLASAAAFTAAVYGIDSVLWLITANVFVVGASILLWEEDSEDLIAGLRWHAVTLGLIAPWLVL